MSPELAATTNAFFGDVESARDARVALILAERKTFEPLQARSVALREEGDRRARAGVRVIVAEGDFDQRRRKLAADLATQAARNSGSHSRSADALEALLFRAVDLIDRMRTELDAPAHAAAVREEAETTAFWADRKARGC